ncbi:MAG: glycoside hydrolase family 5 protein, partial [Gemmatimonadota bacterium]|nr:glycoside hydrolase family 5 protein [Gemmatimonadota bacterium]
APHRFVGISRPQLAYTPDDYRMSTGDSVAADFARIRGWKANVARIEVSQNFWVPTAKWYDPAYPNRVDQAVKAARAAGLDVILTLQTSDRGDPNYPGDIFLTNPQQEMPDVNHSIPFWREVASRYKGDGRILFELFSEPYYSFHGKKSDWNLWLNGGMVPAGRVYDEDRKAFQAVGMQQLYDVVRSTGANNLVIIGGTHWGYYLDGVPTHRVKGYNIAYAAHPWDWPDKQPETWDKDWAFLAATEPVMLTEIGNYDCATGYLSKALDKADQLGLSWVAWAWVLPEPGELKSSSDGTDPTCKSWKLITDWSGTPTAAGRIVKERLARY